MPLNIELGIGADLSTAQEAVAIAADRFTHKAIIYEKDDEASLSRGFDSIIDAAKGAVGLSKPSKVARSVTLFHYEEVSDSVSAEYAETPIRGRSQPYIHYTGTGTNKITFTAKLTTGVDQYSLFQSTDDIIKAINLIRSWVYPEYPLDGPMKPPPTLALIAGDLYRGVPGIIRTAGFTHQRPFNWYHIPMIVDVAIEFEVIYSRPVDRVHIRDNGMTDFGGNKQPTTTFLGKQAQKVRQVFTGVDATDVDRAKSAFTKPTSPGALAP